MRAISPITSSLVVCFLIFSGCMKADNPISPENQNDSYIAGSSVTDSSSANNRYLWGLWYVRVDVDDGSAEVIPLRLAEMHLNTVHMLQTSPCTDCITVSNLMFIPPDELQVDVRLKHPFPGLVQYTGFDVRAVMMYGASYTFPASGRSIAWGVDVPRLINADGYTHLFNPTEFPDTLPVPPCLKYVPGLLAPGGDLSATLNPFIVYNENDERRIFKAGASSTETLRIQVPAGIEGFGYAVDACWQLVEGPINDPLTDFPPDANCLEAYKIIILPLENQLTSDVGSSSPIGVHVYDWQGLDTISEVTIEAPGLFDGTVKLDYELETADGAFLFTGILTNELGAGHGEYPLLVSVVDVEQDQNLGPVDAWHMRPVSIRHGWVRSWGHCGKEYTMDLAVDDEGAVYVVGEFESDATDFDPGPGIDEHSTYGIWNTDAYVSKFNPDGSFDSVKVWGGVEEERANSISIDGTGNLYIAGFFTKEADLDPGPGIDLHESLSTAFSLSKFNSNGDFLWARHWGGCGSHGPELATDTFGNTYVTGTFGGTIDFDPGPGVEERSVVGNMDFFVSKFDTSGEFQWVYTWGTDRNDSSRDVATDIDGNIYVTAIADIHAFQKIGSLLFIKFDTDGAVLWLHSADIDWSWTITYNSITVDNAGYIYMAGSFDETLDFDFGPGVEERTCDVGDDAFLAKYDSNAGFQWVRTWGAADWDSASEVAVDLNGNIYVLGDFCRTVDFDPGPGVFEMTSQYWQFRSDSLSRFDSNGNFIWARSWGTERMSISGSGYSSFFGGVAVFENVSIYATGRFWSTSDFDPGPDIHNLEPCWVDAYLIKLGPEGYW